ncbi:Hypothetical protein, putative [Bodo saltans]|uniref:Uncharacterized protein n=1 Tax=Bodo saltans TaxID=75058 RepID=A0A0S4J1B4_BODSA|nr:Hypothetical protein, putative [Bodo saltans]|eukprot:CUG52926.1 Hypothetical protein, putative [Bodo saltans]
MDGESSEDEELLNFGVAAPEKELSALLDSPLMMQDGPVGMLAATAVDIPPMKVAKGTKKGSSAKKSSAADVSSGQLGAAASSSTYVPPSIESIGAVNSSNHHVLDDLPELRNRQQQGSMGIEDAPAAGNIDDPIDGIVV